VTGLRSAAELTAPVEDYLKVIFELAAAADVNGVGDGVAGTNEIAAALNIAPPSVSGMIRRLAEQGLIAHERYRGVRLTDAGRRAALRTIRRHRVIEAYLTTALGYPWDRVHDEAERLEHAASDELIDRMAAAIGEPATDPHGAPIPTREGRLDMSTLPTLADVQPGTVVQVQRVGDRDAERLRYLAELGIVPGVRLEVLAQEPFDGPITLRIGATQHAVGRTLAGQIFVHVA
jgi:DtxR family Mn-dependent transcriptional regulator